MMVHMASHEWGALRKLCIASCVGDVELEKEIQSDLIPFRRSHTFTITSRGRVGHVILPNLRPKGTAHYAPRFNITIRLY